MANKNIRTKYSRKVLDRKVMHPSEEKKDRKRAGRRRRKKGSKNV